MPENNEEFTQIINEFKALKPGSYVGLDTEDTGLDYNNDQVVGVCVARLDEKYKYVGYYLPVRHNVEGTNLPVSRVFKFTNWLIKRFRCVLFNRSYDFSMLEREEEIEITGFNHDDCQIICWEARYDKFPSLKKFYRLYCKKDIDSFAETVKSSRKAEDSLDETDENSHNFGETDPRYSYPYGAFDPVATLELFFTMMKLFPYTRVIYPLDNRLGEVIRRFTKQEYNLDYDEVRRQLEIEQAKLRQYQREVYEIAGYQFNIKSTREKAEALMRFVTLTVKTKKGQYKVDEEVLKEIDHPLAEAMLKYTEVFTFVNNYLNKLLSVEGTPLRINYKTCEAPTGRLATGQSRGNSFYSPINISAIPSDAEMLYVHKSDGAIPFIANREKEGAIGMVECKAGIRTAFTAPEGYVFMTADFCSEELRVVGNISKEQTFIQAVKDGEDLHMATARKVFGVASKEGRKKVKTINFGVLYGMSVPSLAKRLKVSIFEATKLKARYDQRMSNLTKWIKVQHQRARKNMWVETFFGRRRPLDQWYNTSDPGKIGFANRSAINTPIQGCLPAFCLFEFKDYAVSAKYEQQKLKEHDNPTGGKGVITFRGNSICNFHFSRRGEFFICDTYHKILDDKNHLIQACTLDKKIKVQLSPLQKKKFLLQGIFSVQKNPLARAVSFIKKKNLVNKEKLLYKLFTQAWLQGESITLSMQDAVNLRTVASLHGWNLVLKDFDGDRCICKLKWSRKKLAKFGALRPLGRMPIASVSVRFGRPTYYSQGVVHKNTAADILRMKLCQLYDKMQTDEYWKDNVIVGWSVYDEIELYVKEGAWRRIFKEFEQFMFYQADNWEIPVEVDTGVGSSWGQCLDLKVDNEGRITGIKKVEWFDGMDPFKDGQTY